MTAQGNTRRSRVALALLAATMLTPPDWAEAAPGGRVDGEFQVNSFATGNQNWPAVAADADGDFVVVWMSAGQDGSGSGIFAQRYNAAGVAQGGEFQVNTTTADEQLYPAVAMDTDGDFVVTWLNAWDSSGQVILAQRYDAAGVTQGSEFQVGGLGPGLWSPAVAMNDAGDLVVAWTATTGNQVYDIFAQRFDAAGSPQGGEFLVSTTSADLHGEPAMAVDADGDFVVAWESESPSGDRDILARRYNAAGVAQGSDFRVNASTAGMQVHTAVAMDADGDFVVTWEEWGTYGYSGYGGIFARRYDAAGVAQGDEFRVNAATLDDSRYPAVAMDAEGDFVVAWTSFSAYDGWNAFARRYTGTGMHRGGDFRVNSTTTGGGWAPAVAMESDGDFVVAWAGDDGDALGVFGQRFEFGGPAAASDFNVDGVSDILWRNSSDGRTVVWQVNGLAKEAAADIGNPPSAWKVEDIGDFDGAGHADILWRNSTTGSTVIWQMNGFEKETAAEIGIVGGGWKVAGVGDFDGDAKADILWRNSSTGNTIVWLINGLTKASATPIGAPSLAWKIAGVDDFNGDGRSDILWRDANTGATVIWQMDGFTKVAAATIGIVAGGWEVEATGDFDGGGQADILWRNASSGNTTIWQMNGFTKVAAQSIGTVPSGWLVARVADYDGDGQADILWRNASSGNTTIWQMNGPVKEDAASIGIVSGGWEVQ